MIDFILTVTVHGLGRAAELVHDIGDRLEDLADELDWVRSIEKMRSDAGTVPPKVLVPAGKEYVPRTELGGLVQGTSRVYFDSKAMATPTDAEKVAAQQLDRLLGGDSLAPHLDDTEWYTLLGGWKDDPDATELGHDCEEAGCPPGDMRALDAARDRALAQQLEGVRGEIFDPDADDNSYGGR